MLHHLHAVEDRLVHFYTARRGRLIGALASSMLNWFLGVVEVYVVMQLLGHPVSFADACIIEAVTQLVRAATFVIPASIGAQEGAFLVIGTAITGQPSLALAMALWVNGRLPGRGLVRMAYFTPTILPMIAVANIWLFFYTPQIGLFDQIGALFGVRSRNWLGDPDTVMGCVIAMTVWKEAGFFMIFYLAALQALPPELAEAGRIEGASRGYFFRRVTFPLLMPTTLFVLVNATINAFKLVDHLFILTKGGPDNASNLLLYYIFDVAFSFFNPNYAAALTVVLLVILALMALAQFLFIERRIHYR